MSARDPIHATEFPGAGTASPGEADFSVAEALRHGWLEIWYQPKIDLKRKCLAGAEALARINHPDGGLLLPESFLPEISAGELVQLTEYALITALCDWQSFNDAGFNLRLAINAPLNMLAQVPFAELVETHRPQSIVWPGLILEVPEDQIVRDIPKSRQIAAELKESCISIAIDDFGAGYSSFSGLRDLPFAELKLDGAFVKNCAIDPTNAAICQTVIDLAHRFSTVAVAEGIETMSDLQALLVMGCDFGQGMLLTPPMPKAQFLELLRKRANRPLPARAPVAGDDVNRVA